MAVNQDRGCACCANFVVGRRSGCNQRVVWGETSRNDRGKAFA
jgi:hypothetical protein